MTQNFERSYHFDDIAMAPQKNLCNSRLHADITSLVFRSFWRPVPIIAANMSSVINADFAIQLQKLGALGIMHRGWKNEEDYIAEVSKVARVCGFAAASIGVDNHAFDLAKRLINVGTSIIAIDLANGYCEAAIALGRKLALYFPDLIIVIGNTTCPEILTEVDSFADAVKVGIGSNNNVCSTYDVTGVTEGQFSAVYKFREKAKEYGMPIISDGGCRKSGDFCKAIAAGANSVMMGSVLARCPESAGEITYVAPGLTPKKVYYGMASRKAQDEWKGGLKPGTCPEGRVKLLDLGESVVNLIERYSGALRSSITMTGAYNIETLQERVKFLIIR